MRTKQFLLTLLFLITPFCANAQWTTMIDKITESNDTIRDYCYVDKDMAFVVIGEQSEVGIRTKDGLFSPEYFWVGDELLQKQSGTIIFHEQGKDDTREEITLYTTAVETEQLITIKDFDGGVSQKIINHIKNIGDITFSFNTSFGDKFVLRVPMNADIK